MTVAVVMGVSGSGKTTIASGVAQRLGWRLLEGDAFHPPANVAKMHAGTPLTDEDRWPWLHAIATEIDAVRARGESALVACSALKRAYRDILIGNRPDVRLVYLDGRRRCSTASSPRSSRRGRTRTRSSYRSGPRRRR
jgi:carbohydrate kinase (thermoresistant glucokinase family)